METVAEPLSKDVGVQAENFVSDEEKCLIEKINKLESLLKEKDNQLSKQKFRLMNIKDDDAQVLIYLEYVQISVQHTSIFDDTKLR